ncbi:hypothetical protein C8J56DRAFT_283429 [Mycena floridula]|nr:hypothetical protein C8J56DRAFT_283429 [Mycena floridula]
MTNALDLNLDLPNLVSFYGSPGVIGRLRQVRSLGFPENLEFPGVLPLLERSPGCQDLIVRTDPRCDLTQGLQDVFRSVKHCLPQIRCLYIRAGRNLVCNATDSTLLKSILAEELLGFKQLESFGLWINEAGYNNPDMVLDESWLKNCPTLRECLLELGWWVKHRYKVVNGEARATAELCRMEIAFPFGF